VSGTLSLKRDGLVGLVLMKPEPDQTQPPGATLTGLRYRESW
jgi:hypothetical protein